MNDDYNFNLDADTFPKTTLNYDSDDAIIYGWDFVGTQKQHDNYIQKQLAELSDKMIMAFYGLKLPPILTSPTYSMLALKDMQEKNNRALNEARLDATHDPMNAYVESLK